MKVSGSSSSWNSIINTLKKFSTLNLGKFILKLYIILKLYNMYSFVESDHLWNPWEMTKAHISFISWIVENLR